MTTGEFTLPSLSPAHPDFETSTHARLVIPVDGEPDRTRSNNDRWWHVLDRSVAAVEFSEC